MKTSLKKVATRLITFLSAVLVLLAGFCFAHAEQGYIGNDEIVIDGVAYKNTETEFQKLPPSATEGDASSYDTESDYDESLRQDAYPSLDGQTVGTTVLCADASRSECTVSLASGVIATGEPVYGDSYNGVSLWQKVTYNGKTYYVPVGELDGASETSATSTPSSSWDSQAGYTNPCKGIPTSSGCKEKVNTGSYLVASAGLSDFISRAAIFNKADKITQGISSTRADKILEHMNKAHGDGLTALETCVWASRDDNGNEKPYLEYVVVMDWCDKRGISGEDIAKEVKRKASARRTEEKKPFSITGEYSVTGKGGNWVKVYTNGTMVGLPIAPNMLLSDKLDQKFYIKAGGPVDSAKSNGNNTYIISHGWNSPYGQATGDNNWAVWTKQMAENILINDPKAQVLLLDWSAIAKTATPLQASKWIGPVTDVIADALKKWGINKDKTTVIGFSLGGLLTKKLSEKLGGINLIALDPAASPVAYKTDFDNTSFASFGGSGACLVADASWSGSEALMKTCREGYLIDYSGNPDFPLFEELHKYVDFVIDEAVAEGLEYVVDQGATYTIEKAVGRSIKGRLRGVRMYKILNGKLVEVFVENLKEKACEPVDAALKYLPYICEFGLEKIKDRFVTYHANVHKVYDTIISNPFSGNVLSPQNLASRKGGSAPFAVIENGANGIIYTEQDNPYKIKYLKVLKTSGSPRYTLYGNTQSNILECSEGKDCEMFGGGGEDRFYHKIQPNSLYVEDFKANENDGDKVFIHGGFSDITAVQTAPKTIRITATYKSNFGRTNKYVNVVLENTTWNLEAVQGWVKVALKGTSNKKKDNPVQIQ
ncbi:MAG: hypothetical protein PHU25_01195 [Deltaproteobacteria bacterium]|nr:hypothetical protein [Deltaproteobacteria bacterium]